MGPLKLLSSTDLQVHWDRCIVICFVFSVTWLAPAPPNVSFEFMYVLILFFASKGILIHIFKKMRHDFTWKAEPLGYLPKALEWSLNFK